MVMEWQVGKYSKIPQGATWKSLLILHSQEYEAVYSSDFQLVPKNYSGVILLRHGFFCDFKIMATCFTIRIGFEELTRVQIVKSLKYFKGLNHIPAFPSLGWWGLDFQFNLHMFCFWLCLLTNLVALLWTLSISSASRLISGNQMGVQYSSMFLTRDL